MKYLRVSVQILLLVMLVLVPTLTAFASGRSFGPSVPCVSFQQGYGENSTIPVGSCCPAAQFSPNGISSVPVTFSCCGITTSLFGISPTIPVVASGLRGTPYQTMMAAFVPVSDPCDQTCGLTLPDGSVVGAMMTDEQAYWAPGKISPNVIINAGTYWVTGEEKDDAGNEFYRILVACQYLWVPIDTMQPSYQTPWSGQPLPTFSV